MWHIVHKRGKFCIEFSGDSNTVMGRDGFTKTFIEGLSAEVLDELRGALAQALFDYDMNKIAN